MLGYTYSCVKIHAIKMPDSGLLSPGLMEILSYHAFVTSKVYYMQILVKFLIYQPGILHKPPYLLDQACYRSLIAT